jgi:hypothetical protein
MPRLALALVLPLLAAAPAFAQDEGSKEVQAAKALVKKQAENVIKFAHPPATKYTEAAVVSVSPLKDGFELVYLFVFDATISSNLLTKIKFTFDKTGKLDYVTPVSTTARYQPFTTDVSKKKLAELKELVKSVPAVKDDRTLLRKVDEAADSKVLLEIWLKHSAG